MAARDVDTSAGGGGVRAVAVTSSAPRAEAQREARTATPDLGRAINQYCAGCHNERARTTATASGVILDQVDLARVADNGAMWEKVIRKLRAGAMPPAGAPRPDATTHDELASFSRRRWIVRRLRAPIPAGSRRTG